MFVPAAPEPALEILRSLSELEVNLPLYATPVCAGFPSPAEDYIENLIDLNKQLIRNPPATFLARVKGNSMSGAGIHDGDILVVDRSVSPADGHVVIGVIDGEFTCKRVSIQHGRVLLMPENPRFQPIEINEATEFRVWGVVTYTIHKHA